MFRYTLLGSPCATLDICIRDSTSINRLRKLDVRTVEIMMRCLRTNYYCFHFSAGKVVLGVADLVIGAVFPLYIYR